MFQVYPKFSERSAPFSQMDFRKFLFSDAEYCPQETICMTSVLFSGTVCFFRHDATDFFLRAWRTVEL